MYDYSEGSSLPQKNFSQSFTLTADDSPTWDIYRRN